MNIFKCNDNQLNIEPLKQIDEEDGPILFTLIENHFKQTKKAFKRRNSTAEQFIEYEQNTPKIKPVLEDRIICIEDPKVNIFFKRYFNRISIEYFSFKTYDKLLQRRLDFDNGIISLKPSRIQIIKE